MSDDRQPASLSVLQDWVTALPLQQQAVLIMACRGPDGYPKYHPSKHVVRAARGCVLLAAYYGRPLRVGESADTFMDMSYVGHPEDEPWRAVVRQWAEVEDGLPLHFYQHAMQAANILRFQHPDSLVAGRWEQLYLHCCAYLHVPPESRAKFEARLNDWDRRAWGDDTHAPQVIAAAKADDLRVTAPVGDSPAECAEFVGGSRAG